MIIFRYNVIILILFCLYFVHEILGTIE